jgi:hypothetical protein
MIEDGSAAKLYGANCMGEAEILLVFAFDQVLSEGFEWCGGIAEGG